ncbi:uncharacterized protein LOC109596265 [Aethina tumida]|uniref:uncharacterized protein LOC109596265 n=1 Tax=Aethina tumida TaxID=116153 RepID=UPI002147F263|nr:uncharacterized protein LOC109596265 [Aethina tumida]
MTQRIFILIAISQMALALSCSDQKYENPTTEKCGTYIKNYSFDEAEAALLQANETQLNQIITELISEDQFNPLLSFADYTTNLSTSLQIIKKLYSDNEELKSSIKHTQNLRRIIRSLSKIYHQDDAPWRVKEEADNLLKIYKQSIINDAKQTVELYIKSKNCYLDFKNQNTATLTYVFDKGLFAELIRDVISDLYGLVSTNKLLAYVDSFSNLDQKIIGLQYLYNILTMKERMSSTIVIFVEFINKVIKDPLYSKVDKLLQDKIKAIDLSLPKSLKYAITSPRVCIVSAFFNESFYAYSLINKTYNARPVFTWIPTKVEGLANSTQNYWVITQDYSSSTFLIKNSAYNEYLYVDGNFDKDRRNVFTRADGAKTNAGKWYLEPTCDYQYVYIKDYNGEYIYPAYDGLNFDNQRRRVFAWVPQTGTFNEGKFKIFPC